MYIIGYMKLSNRNPFHLGNGLRQNLGSNSLNKYTRDLEVKKKN